MKLLSKLKDKHWKRDVKQFIVSKQDAPIEEWINIVNLATWKEALSIKQEFLLRTDERWSEHDKQISGLLHQRLFDLELPTLQIDVEKDGYLPFRVDDGATNSEILSEVAYHFTKGRKPQFVVEDCGKLRGFVISPDLVVVGVTSVAADSDTIQKKANELGYSLLGVEDISCLEEHWDILNKMMQYVGVPNLENVDVFHLSKKHYAECMAWNHVQGQTYELIKENDVSFLLAKL